MSNSADNSGDPPRKKKSVSGKSKSSKSSSKAPSDRGFVARQANASGAAEQMNARAEVPRSADSAEPGNVREAELLERMGAISIPDVLALSRATSGFLTSPSQPSPVRFRRLKVTMGESDGDVLFDQVLVADTGADSDDVPEGQYDDDDDVSAACEVSYILPAVSLGAVCTAYTEFKATREVKDFYMVERFFFEDILLKDLRFSFGFCIPGSINTASLTYDCPEISDDLRRKIIANPKKVRADSFYFDDGVLFMHYKSNYTYV